LIGSALTKYQRLLTPLLSSKAESERVPYSATKINLIGTMNVFEAARITGINESSGPVLWLFMGIRREQRVFLKMKNL